MSAPSHVLTEAEIEAFKRRVGAAGGRMRDLYWTHEEMGRALATIHMLSVRVLRSESRKDAALKLLHERHGAIAEEVIMRREIMRLLHCDITLDEAKAISETEAATLRVLRERGL